MFPLADDGIDQVDASIFKQVLQILAWLATGGLGLWLGKSWGAKGTKESPVAIEQPLAVQKHDAAAKQSELKKLETSITSLAEQINAQFAAMTKAGQDRAAAITQSMDDELRVITGKIEVFMLMATRHDAVIPQIEERLSALSAEHNNAVQRLHSRVDDAMRLNLSPRKP